MPEINEKIFKSYDVRGIYPEDLTLEAAEKVGRGLVKISGAKIVAVARDMRLGGEELFSSLTNGVTANGANVIDIGLASIDGLYFAVGKYGYDAGVMITASHNPKEYNGFKIVTRDDKGVDVMRGIDIKEAVMSENFICKIRPGRIEKRDIWNDYLAHIFSFVDIIKIKPLKIVVDAGNGLAGKVIPLLEKRLPVEIIKMNFEVDGNFPGHPSNPLEPESHEPLQKRVIEEKAAVGFIFDGDTDRIFLVDDKGNFLRGDTTLIFLAKYFLDNNLGKIIIYNAICSKAVPEMVKKMGGRAFREKVGYVNLSARMKKEGGVLSGEVSGHYSFARNFYADSGFIALLTILQVLSESSEPLSAMVRGLNPYFRGDEVNIKFEDREAIEERLERIRQEYKNYKQDELDGVTVNGWDKEGWWFNVRPSNTEPMLRVMVEGKTSELQAEKEAEVLGVVR